MPVFALYNFDDVNTTALDSALGNGAQNGIYLNGATATGGQAVLDGINDMVKIYADPTFQMDRGTLDITFTLGEDPLTDTQTVLSRDSVGETDGGYHIDILADGSVVISHETTTGTETFGTAAGFAQPGDTIDLSYSWDQGGTGGQLVINNTTDGTSFSEPVPNTVTMDMGGAVNQPWIIGAGQSSSNPNMLNNIDQNFQGTVEMFQLSDTVDNLDGTPDANPDVAETDEDTPVTIPVLNNDTDPNGQPLTVTTATAPNGTVSVNPDGTLTYTPNDDFNGTDTITYTVTDPDGNTDSSTVSVTVHPVNDAPVAADDTSATAFNTPVTFAVMGNDTDVDGDTLTISGTPTSADGTVVVNADGTLTFTPNAGFTGDATVSYTVTDPEGLTDSATWTITVANVDRDGIVRGTDAGELIDTAYVDPFDADRVDANDALLPGEVGNDDIIEAGAGNDTILAGDGNDDVRAGSGDDSVIGGVGDDLVNGGVGNDTVLGGDGDDVITSGAAGSPDRSYPGLYTADTNPNDDRDSVVGGAGNDVIAAGDDADTISGGTGNDLIDAGVDDDTVSGGASDDTIIAGEGNDTVSGDFGNDLIYGGLSTAITDPINLADAADLDPMNNRDVLSGGAGADTIYGLDDDDTLSGNDGNDLLDGGLDDDLISGGDGTDQLIGGQGDDTLSGDLGHDALLGGEGNDLVQGGAGNDTVTDGAGNDTMVGGADRDVFIGANAGDDIDGSGTGDDFDTLDLRGVGPISIVYDPANAENGTVTFLDAAGNPTGTMDFVEIENVLSDVPDANPDTATTPEDTPVTVPVLANDTDPNGDPLTVTTATAPHGTVTINPDGTLTYTPDPDFNGTDVITYTVTDPDGNQDTSTVTVTVTPENDVPDAVDDASSTPLDTPITFAVMGNDTDVDGDTLAIQGTPTSANGTVTVNGDGTLTFTPNAGFTGVATVDYTIVDEEGLTDTATWTITVVDPNSNQPPVAEDDEANTVVDTPVTIAILANDSDPDGDILAIVGTPTSADGTVVVNPDGTITFTPDPGFVGEATINYLVTDGNGGTDPAVVTVTVIDPGTRDGIVRGTTGNDVIDVNYPNDNDGDFVDRGDAILPGDAPNDDRILAGDGDDTVMAGKGGDSVEGGTGDDVINGQNGADTIFGQVGDDTIVGQNGDDSIYGGLGNDSVRGGTGDDMIDTSGDTLPLPDKGYPGIYPSDDNPTDDLDTVRGGAGNDTIRTGDDNDVIDGGYGNDLIDGGFDDDTIDGNQGNDTIIGAEGNDLIDGGLGDDLVYGGYGPNVPDAVNIPDSTDLRPDNGRDLIAGGMGNDTIYGMDDDDTIDGGQDNDLIYGGIDEDSIRGNVGNDQLFGDQGNDTMGGGQGNDTLNGGEGTDVLNGDADRDTFVVGSQPNGSGDTVYGGASGDDWDVLDLRGAGPYRLTGVTPDSDGNGIDGSVQFLDDDGNVTGTMTFTNIEEVIPCFTPGTLIATPKGEVPVESLKAGDRVITRDNGIQEIRWTGQKALGWKDLAANPHMKPVLIRQGSLGNGLPERDMMVSPNHRMLVANDRTALYFDEHEVLVSAKHLVAGQGIQSIDSIGTTYIHFMFDRHEVVLSNGAWTESFQPGDYTLKGMGNAQRAEIFELFPELKTEAGLSDYQAARRTLKKHEARLLVK